MGFAQGYRPQVPEKPQTCASRHHEGFEGGQGGQARCGVNCEYYDENPFFSHSARTTSNGIGRRSKEITLVLFAAFPTLNPSSLSQRRERFPAKRFSKRK